MSSQRCIAFLLLLLLRASTVASGVQNVDSEIAKLLEATGTDFQSHWKHVVRAEPLVPIDLNDVEAWLKLDGNTVRNDDVELFALPPSKQHGLGGSFNSAPEPVKAKGRLQRVRKEFGAGRAMVINSLHNWCPKAAKLAASLREQVGLPVDVYMYLTPPYSHSYGLHSDVMDAFMVQLVGDKHWTACDAAENCTNVHTINGDVLYLPFGAKHSAWTSDQLSAHLTVNVERQFFVWGSVLQALAKRLLLPNVQAQLDRHSNMQAFGMEEEGEDAQFVHLMYRVSAKLPSIMYMPAAVLNYTRNAVILTGASMEDEFGTLLQDLIALEFKGPFALKLGPGSSRNFKSVTEMFKAIDNEGRAKKLSALDWLAKIITNSVTQLHQQHGGQRLPKDLNVGTNEQKLGGLAEARAARLRSLKAEL